MAANVNNVKSVVRQVVLDELTESFNDDERDVVMEICLLKDKNHPEYLGSSWIEGYVEVTVPRYSDPLFRAHFRMTSFQSLLELIGPLTAVRSISLERRTLACLWYLSNQETFRSVADRFGLSKGSLHYYIGNFCRLLSGGVILPKLISWPDKSEYKYISEGFAARAGFPGVVGALDGTHIQIPGPSDYRDSYICRKGFPAFHLQGICDRKLKFLDIFCAYPGSVHDSRVFRNSPISQCLETLPKEYHVLGDSAYGMHEYPSVPFRDNGHLTKAQKKFNFIHRSTRVDIERCFGLLKGKFRKLKYLDVTSVSIIPNVIASCCVLHNFVINHEGCNEMPKDVQEQHSTTDASSEADREIVSSCPSKREEIMNMLA